MNRKSIILALWIVLSVAWVLTVAVNTKQQEDDFLQGISAYHADAAKTVNEFCHGQAFDRSMDLTRYSDRQLFSTADGLGLIQPRGPLYVGDRSFGGTRPWAAVTQSADFQKMSAADRELERQQYFQDDVQLRLFDGRLAQDARAAFDAAYGAPDVGNSSKEHAQSADAIPGSQTDVSALSRNTIEEAYYLFSKCALARSNMDSANRAIPRHVSAKSAALTAIISPIAVLLVGLMGYIFVRLRRRARISEK
jgi:hypothetical protein